jgi:uncharacterized protein (DUF488 family)
MPQKFRLKLPSGSPKQQAENRILWNDSRSPQAADFFTVGYSGRGIDDFMRSLVHNGVRTLVDVRQNAVSMYRPELSKNNLKRRVEDAGLQYIHMPELGVPRDIRAKAIAAGTREVIWHWYDQYVAKPYFKNLHHFLNATEHPVAFMCTELDPCECHRHRLFVELESKGLRGYEL